MKAFVYILQDGNGRFYIGSTPTLEKRLKQHTSGHTQTTRNMFNPKLVLKQEVSSITIARNIERKLKKMKRRKQEKRLNSLKDSI